jgi:hypothetical protein
MSSPRNTAILPAFRRVDPEPSGPPDRTLCRPRP